MHKPRQLTLKHPKRDQTDVKIEFPMRFRIFWSGARFPILDFDVLWTFSLFFALFPLFLAPKPQEPAQTVATVI